MLDFKWLKDFPKPAGKHGFSRVAKVREVAQSAFRRIQALHKQIGGGLVIRETHPAIRPKEGKLFHEAAEETVRMLSARQP